MNSCAIVSKIMNKFLREKMRSAIIEGHWWEMIATTFKFTGYFPKRNIQHLKGQAEYPKDLDLSSLYFLQKR